MDIVGTRDPHPFHDVVMRIHIDPAMGEIVEPRYMNRSRIDHRPFDQTALCQLQGMAEAIGVLVLPEPGTWDGRVNNHIHLVANALDDACINLPVIFLTAGRHIIGMGMDDCRARLGARNAVGDDLLDGDGNAPAALRGSMARSVRLRSRPWPSHHFPVQTGLRFSANAARPSFASCVMASTAICDSV